MLFVDCRRRVEKGRGQEDDMWKETRMIMTMMIVLMMTRRKLSIMLE